MAKSVVLKAGDKAPAFALKDQSGKSVKLSMMREGQATEVSVIVGLYEAGPAGPARPRRPPVAPPQR